MSTAPAGALWARLVDDAAVFPPGNAPLPQAVEEHRAHRRSWYAGCVGPLLVRLADTPALADLLADDEGLAVALVCPAGSRPDDVLAAVGALRRRGRAEVVGIELPLPDPADRAQLVGSAVPVWFEVTADDVLDAALDAVSASGANVKLRTGGLVPQAFPTEKRLAAFVVGALVRGLRFKLTAGLHHAVRHTGTTSGFEHHGLLNVIAATAAARGGAGQAEVVALLAERDGRRLREAVSALGPAAVRETRAAFASFGCCGVGDPLRDLADLHLLDPPEEHP